MSHEQKPIKPEIKLEIKPESYKRRLKPQRKNPGTARAILPTFPLIITSGMLRNI